MATLKNSKNRISYMPAGKTVFGGGPTLEWEIENGFPQEVVVGVDEVGRGCLVGPVVAAAVLLPSYLLRVNSDEKLRADWAWVQDSKKIQEQKRNEVSAFLKENLEMFSIGEASAEEIDSLNIHHATLLAMKRALQGIDHKLTEKLGNQKKQIATVLVDGKFGVQGFNSIPIVKGDQKSLSIAAASIVAKVHRDSQMHQLSSIFPQYAFGVHKGYPTELHRKKIEEFGVTQWHRRSFGPVAEVLRKDALRGILHEDKNLEK